MKIVAIQMYYKEYLVLTLNDAGNLILYVYDKDGYLTRKYDDTIIPPEDNIEATISGCEYVNRELLRQIMTVSYL